MDRPTTVLYVEDNLANLRLIERVLDRRGGVSMIQATSGALGIDLARKHLPDLILLDLGLPDMKGDEVFARLRGDPATAGIPVIVLSADATASEIDRMLAAGADDYVTKPIDVVRFLEIFERRLVAGVVAGVRPGQGGVSSAGSAPVLDEGILAQLRDIDALSEIGDLFLTQSSIQFEAVKSAAQRDDAETLKRELHALKGLSATAGAARLADRCRRFEESLRSSDTTDPAELDLLEAELHRARSALAAESAAESNAPGKSPSP